MARDAAQRALQGESPWRAQRTDVRASSSKDLYSASRGKSALRRKQSLKTALKPEPAKEGARLVREVAHAFLSADKSGDRRLTFDEFLDAVPAQMKANRSERALKSLFNVVDADKDGAVSIDEFFIWTLSFLQDSQASGLEEVFQHYNIDGKPELNAMEFAMAAEDIGFGELANDLFVEFDPENTGSIRHKDIINLVQQRVLSRNAKRLLTEIAFDADRRYAPLDVSTWVLHGESKEVLRAELLKLMRDADPPARVSELFQAMADAEDATVLRRDDFQAALESIGLPHGKDEWLAEAVFRQIDVRDEGFVGVPELRAWINGVEIRKAAAKELTIRSQPGGPELMLDLITWSPEVLCEQLQLVLISSRLAPLDLLRAWDSRNDGTFAKKDLLRMVKFMLDDQEVWDYWVRDTVVDIYNILYSAHKATLRAKDEDAVAKGLPICELQTFMQAGWSDLKHRLEGRGAIRRKVPPAAPRPALEFGDPRWPHRVWPSRRGDTAFARRRTYKPPPGLTGSPVKPITPLLPPWRLTANSIRRQPFIMTREAQGIWKEMTLNKSKSAPRLVQQYMSAGGPEPLKGDIFSRAGSPPPARVPYGGASTSTWIVTYKRSASLESLKGPSLEAEMRK